MSKLILYHGSPEIIQTPVLVKENPIMTTDGDFIVLSTLNLLKSGLVLKIPMDTPINMK